MEIVKKYFDKRKDYNENLNMLFSTININEVKDELEQVSVWFSKKIARTIVNEYKKFDRGNGFNFDSNNKFLKNYYF